MPICMKTKCIVGALIVIVATFTIVNPAPIKRSLNLSSNYETHIRIARQAGDGSSEFSITAFICSIVQDLDFLHIVTRFICVEVTPGDGEGESGGSDSGKKNKKNESESNLVSNTDSNRTEKTSRDDDSSSTTESSNHSSDSSSSTEGDDSTKQWRR